MSAIELDRERVIQALCAHFASDHLSTQELESRIDRAYKAGSPGELQALLSSLPALPHDAVRAAPVVAAGTGAVQVGEVASRKRSLVVMSEVVKQGEWIPAHKNIVHALMGSATIDLREALLSPGETEFELNAVMSEIKVIVPPGLRVACDGLAIMAEFKEYHSSGIDDPGAPLVRIHGVAVMASVTVQTRLSGESQREARRRRRLERSD